MPAFVHLHNHSEYSLLDGLASFEAITRRLRDTGMDAFALTDHGVLYGAVGFHEKMKEEGFHPIIGCEFYVAPRSLTDRSSDVDRLNRHLILLAENNIGYKNLLKLVTISWTQGYYYRPRIDFETLSQFKEGLIILSACLQGVISASFLQEGPEVAAAEIEKYARLIGEEHFFLEVQNHGLQEESLVREFLIDSAKKLGLPLVATNDCHYAFPEDAGPHDVALCLQTRVKQADEERLRFAVPEYYIKTPSDMWKLFSEIPEACQNTLAIAKRCNVEVTDGKVHFPSFSVPTEQEELTHEGFLRKLAYEGAAKRYGEPLPQQVVDRLEEELSVINSTGFATLFLIVWDLMRYAREKAIPTGPGRGSAAGSLVAYCLFITKLDPLKYGLIFERFLNKERVELPDFDLDFCFERRDEMIEYVKNRYGEDCVAQIITFSTLKARAALKAVGRVKNLEFAYVDRLTKKITGLNVRIEDALKSNPELAAMVARDPTARELTQDASKLEGLVSHVSVHAAGVVISDASLVEYVPLRTVKDSTMLVTQYDMDAIAKVGLLKFDFLGLKTLTVIDKCVRYVREILGETIDIDSIPLDDQSVYENIYTSGNTFGVFQFEAPHIVRVMRETRPSSIEDLTALNALNRPGPMQSGMVELYVRNSKGQPSSKPALPELEAILAPTGGVLLYQEQVMMIARELAGHSLGEADILRKAMGKKIPALMKTLKDDFISRSVARGVKKKKAEEIWEMMEKFAGYGFNKAHSACYAYLSYQTAYLKHYYPQCFMAAFMNCYMDDSEKMAGALHECKRANIKIIPPSINLSHYDFIPTRNREIIFGLGGIKHIGKAAVDEIVSSRQSKGRFTSVEDFFSRINGGAVNRTAVEFLIKAGAFDEFSVERGYLLSQLDWLMSTKSPSSQIDVFSDERDLSKPYSVATSPDQIAQMERESIGVYLTHNPFEYALVLKDDSIPQISDIFHLLEVRGVYLSGAKVSVGGVLDEVEIKLSRKKQRYATAKLTSANQKLNLVVVPSSLPNSINLLRDGNEVVVTGIVNLDDSIDDDVETLSRSLKIYVDKVELYVPPDSSAGFQTGEKSEATLRRGARAERRTPIEVHLRFDKLPSAQELADVMAKLSSFPGQIPVFLILVLVGDVPRKIYLGDNCRIDWELFSRAEVELPAKVRCIYSPTVGKHI